MAAGMRAVLDVADTIDVVIEVRDARLPRTTAVAHLHKRLAGRPTFIVLNRTDLAEDAVTKAWLSSLRTGGAQAFGCVATRAGTIRELRRALLAQPRRRGRLRAIVVGAPNTGKSSLINSLGRTKRVTAEDRAGVTRRVRWLDLDQNVQILDTPGLLAPRIMSADAAWQLALCGSLPETAHDVEETVRRFHDWLTAHRPQLAADADLDAFAAARGMRRRGGELDLPNAARTLVARFRAGELFRVTFERPDDGR